MDNQVLLDRLKSTGVDVDQAINRFMGNDTLYLDFMRRLPRSLKLSELEQTLTKKDADEFYALMHDLKGTAGNLGLLDVFDASQAALVEFRSTNLRNRKKMWGLVKEIQEDCQKILIILEEDRKK